MEKENARTPVGVLMLQDGTAKPDPAMPGCEKGRVPHVFLQYVYPQQAMLSPHLEEEGSPGPEELSEIEPF